MDNEPKAYEKLKEDLKKSLQEQKDLEDEFDRLQQEIYDKETEYFGGKSSGSVSMGFGKTSCGGNIIRGFDAFNKSHHGHGHGHESSSHFTNDDRLFSLSSAVFVKQLRQEDSQDHIE
ncbi:hypothetical protein HG536_0B04120 [Torulaspora globosa]|uniref:Chromatin modification-related protein EAF6 n=1 Tax=Torulaspora globosa TaxID=48254 RepID=A0A7G3ZDG2_9SACH|nr:uncharacterized protein HG536_0B04120 [Torulaspora globosa]QLL31548.1 hypothetical protein HG536_0B04120 [Torulaspora globosa]